MRVCTAPSQENLAENSSFKQTSFQGAEHNFNVGHHIESSFIVHDVTIQYGSSTGPRVDCG